MFSDHFFAELCYANGTLDAPHTCADVKVRVDDFCVDEIMNVELSGEGEHIWLHISKTRMHTDQITKALAKVAGVHVKDVGVSGMKDYLATTRQWFSVWLPGVKDKDLPDWHSIASDAITIEHVGRHHRKLKRGTHEGNAFKIMLRDIDGDLSSLEESLEYVKTQGVPNYFGEQRFGRGGSNLHQTYSMFESGRKIKQRQKRSMLLSTARSWLFNLVLSERLKINTWLEPQIGEPLNLSGSRQIFIADDLAAAEQRIQQQDVHTTGPLWGLGSSDLMQQASDLDALENTVMDRLQVFKAGLESAKLDYARRALRCIPQDLRWHFTPMEEPAVFSGQHAELQFSLGKGQFATSVLRELVQARAHSQHKINAVSSQ